MKSIITTFDSRSVAIYLLSVSTLQLCQRNLQRLDHPSDVLILLPEVDESLLSHEADRVWHPELVVDVTVFLEGYHVLSCHTLQPIKALLVPFVVL